MVPISLPGFPEPLDSRVIATIAEPDFASEFPFQRDMNTGDTVRFIAVVYYPDFFNVLPLCKQIGVGWIQGAIGHGRRSSSAATYVGPDYINRPNLHILVHAQATKILEATDQDSTTPCFNGVEFGLATGLSSELITRPIAWIRSLTGHKVNGGR